MRSLPALMPVATLASLVAAVPLLGTVVTGSGWWFPAVLMMAAMAAASALYRLTGWSAVAVPFLQILVMAVLLTPLFAAHTAVLGLVPTSDTFPELVRVLERGIDAIDTNRPPVTGTAGVALIIAVALAVIAMAADFLAVTARCPGMVGGLLVALLAVPLTVDDGGLSPGGAVSASVGFLVLLAVDMWLRGREWGIPVPDGRHLSAPDGRHPPMRFLVGLRRTAVAAVSIAAAVLLALAVPLTVPSLRSDIIYQAADGTYVGRRANDISISDPLVSLRSNLATSFDRTVLTYTTDAEEPEYLRIHVLDEFDGVNWTMTPVETDRGSRVGDELPLPAGWSGEPDGPTATTRISMDSDALSLNFLPMPYWPRSVDVSGEWYADPESLVVFTTDSPPTGLSYTVESASVATSADELVETGRPWSVPGSFFALPDDVDPRVAELTETVTEGADSPYERAVALQEHFADGGFRYDLSPPPVPEGADPLVHFLVEDRVGYCEQFAGAMAVMARQADIPSRVATGFTAGQQMGDGRWSVSTGDAHAWPELYFEDVGWVRFEPTPASSDGQGSATVPDYADGEYEDEEPEHPETDPTADDEPESDEPTDEPEESTPPEGEETDGATAASGSEPDPGGWTVPAWLPAVGAVLVGLLLAALPALVRIAVRGSRTAALTGGSSTAAAHAAWRELRDTCLDLGVTWDLTESPRAVAVRLAARGAVPDQFGAALWRLALGEESARYAPEPAAAPGSREDLRAVRAGLAAASGRGDRFRAVLLPRSLAPWRRPRAAVGIAPTIV